MPLGRRLLILPALLAVLAPVSPAADGNVRVEGAWARGAPMIRGDSSAGSGNGAVYATLVNPGSQPDALVTAVTDVAGKVEIHESYQDRGMMMMRPVSRIEVPAGKKVEMRPGGYHIMLLNLKRDLKAGQSITLTLRFDKAGPIPVTAVVK